MTASTRRIAACAVVLAALAFVAGCGSEAPPRTAVSATAPATVAPAATTIPAATGDNSIRTIGEPNAPITIVMFSDYQCPFCARFVQDVKPQLEEQYVATGKVRLEYRDFPLTSIHGSAALASHVANCAADQGAFWPMHDRLFAGYTQGEWGKDMQTDFSTMLGYAQSLELNAETLQSCVVGNTHSPQIQRDFDDGAQAGIRSTPSFLVNGKLLVGAQPFEVWKSILDSELTGTPTP